MRKVLGDIPILYPYLITWLGNHSIKTQKLFCSRIISTLEVKEIIKIQMLVRTSLLKIKNNNIIFLNVIWQYINKNKTKTIFNCLRIKMNFVLHKYNDSKVPKIAVLKFSIF
jgi:hypothetical protein